MSIDFDSAALQTQHEEEEEYDQEDYAREQELHKLLTDLPGDMLEDSRDSSSPDLDYSTCSHPGNNNNKRPQHFCGHSEWSNQPRPLSVEDNPHDGYDQSHHQGCTYDNTASQPNSHVHHLQGGMDHLPQAWDAHHCENYQHESEDYVYSCDRTAESDGVNFSSGEGYEQETYLHTGGQGQGKHAIVQNHFQNFDNGITESKDVDTYKVSYHPHKPPSAPKMFSTQASHQNGHFNQLQRDFLDSSPSAVDAQECAQVKILNKAQSRQIEELEQKLEDNRRKMRYLDHQFAIVRDEKEGLAVSLKESSCLIEELKERESQLKVKVRSLEQQIQVFTEREQENMKKQHAAQAAVDSMQQQMMELHRSDTLTRAREQHDRDMAVLKEQHEARMLALQQQMDSHVQNLDQQVQATQRLREQVRQLEKQREAEQVDRATVINVLTKRLEESQQQCAKLLQTGCVQEMSQMQIKLQQAQSSRNISENMNRALQEELNELKEQITFYESAVKLGAVAFDLNTDWENHLSESCIDLGIKAVNRNNGRNHSTPVLSDSSLPKGDLVRELKNELQRCLAQLKTKRQKISQLQEDLKISHDHVEQLQKQLAEAEKNVKDSAVRERCLEKHLEPSDMAPHKELARLEEERQQLQKRVEALETHNKELKQSEEKLKAANCELCTKMREMIQELDQEKQEAAERYERTQQQYRDDVVQHVRAELTQEHTTHVEHLTAQHQQHIQQLESKLANLSQEVLAVQECYISVCKEKDKLEETLQSRIDDEEKKLGELELKRRGEAEVALERLKADLASQHQQALDQFKAQCTKESEREIQQQVSKQLASAQKSWQQEQEELERKWACRVEEAVEGSHRARTATTQEGFSQTDSTETATLTLSLEQLEARLSAQRTALQREADSALAKAVGEAVRQTEGELQQKHGQDMASQVESAVSRAYGRWLQDLTSLPEYKASLQTEREKWEKLQQQHIQEQVSSAKKAAEDVWQETMDVKCKELEDCMKRNRELQEQVLSLNTQLENVTEERAALLEAELFAARTAWNREKQEEVSGLRSQLQREQQENQARLERSTERAWEEALAQSQETLRNKEEEWRCQQALRLREEQCRTQEEVLAELKEVLIELQNLKREALEDRGSRDFGVRVRLRDLCREALSKAVAHTKQECQKSSEDKLRHVLKESQEQHKKELWVISNFAAQTKDGVCSSVGCTETVAKLQKSSQDLQRHLEKACRQLQRTVREHKSTLHKLKEEHEENLRREREAHGKELEEVKLTICKESGGAVNSQQNLQAGLEEMKQQYMKAVQKIRGDMLHYLQDSKVRAAELIRAEVQRERQDTARRMRSYYLTCLHELLDEGGQTTGAEKKIISAASKLAAMAKVLETPQPKKKLQRNPNGQVPLSNPETNNEHPTTVSGAASSQSLPVIPENHEDYEKNQVRQIHSITETNRDTQTAKLRELKMGFKTSQAGFLGSVRGSAANGLGMAEQVTPMSLHYHSPKVLGAFASSSVHSGDIGTTNVTLRKQSRDMYLIGNESGKALTPQLAADPSLVEEAPVRDDGQSDWSLSSNGSTFTNHVYLTTSYPSKNADAVRLLSVAGPQVNDLDFGSTLGDNSDVTVYKEIVKKPACVKPKRGTSITASKVREPTPGSEEQRIHRLCPKSLFSEFKVRQQDSGFDSPLSQIQK
ncbi:centrosomal protein of 152 kDa [Electrophorus electricus]|uniref:centrosomal protein of 152 kDa n=1 Tax=Electrophorus electricus TaxID=8005 RepID=UPI0015D0A19F|nr:centrosomal protein of 152 kDa [Electrophorus electricus]